jgi:hypothetical protein
VHVQISKQTYESRLNPPIDGKDQPPTDARALAAWSKRTAERLANEKAAAIANKHVGIDIAQDFGRNFGRDVPCPARGARRPAISVTVTNVTPLKRENDGSYTTSFTVELYYR